MTLRRLLTALLVTGSLLAFATPNGRLTTTSTPPTADVAGRPQAEAGSPATDVDAGWWAAVQERIRQQEYHVTWQETTYLPDVPAAYQAPNRAQNLRTYFTAGGPVVIPRVWPESADGPPWRWELRLTAWGREEAAQSLAPAVLRVQENLIEYGRGELVEWYRNDEHGLEQGFTLMAQPSGLRTERPVRMDFALGGDLVPQVVREGAEIDFRTQGGQSALQYGSLAAVDAAGRQLPVWLSLQDVILSLFVDDAGAVYPITVDPTIAGLPGDYDKALGLSQADAQFGFSAATAGDVNGDGYSEVIVGAPYFDGGLTDEGKAFVFYGSMWGLWAIGEWSKEIDQGGAEFGYAVATAGDVNGDGYTDVIVGAPEYSNSQDEEGGVWVYHGSRTGLSSTHSAHKECNQDHCDFGKAVATAGDVNKDGYADIIVGAPSHNGGLAVEGRVFVWHGGSGGIPTGVAHWYAESNQYTGELGTSVGTAGDIDGDGYADVIVGASGYSAPSDNEGAAFVWYGSENGVNNDVNGHPGNAPWMVDSDQANARLGVSVGMAGDVNGDGYTDVIVGAHLYNSGHVDEGAAWLYLGSSSGLETSWDNMDEGNQTDAWFGYRVGTAGDVNGDGFADVIVGAPLFTSDADEAGRAWVWHGSPDGISPSNDWNAGGSSEQAWFGSSVATAGDVNGDGYSDVIVGAPGDFSKAGTAYVYHGAPSSLSETALWTKLSNMGQAQFGWSVGTAGDVNGDGYADVIVGSPRWDGGKVLEGAAWIYRGKEGGLTSAPDWYERSDKAGAQFGWSVGTAGDVNGDGYSDVIVGAPTWTNGQTEEGKAFVYEGSVGGLPPAPAWSKESDNVDAQFGYSVGTAGDVNGDGLSDVIVGSPFYKDDGKAWVYLGAEAGLRSAPHWHHDCDQSGSEFGYSVGTAGDVNRDGYSDIVVGARMYNGGLANEGKAWVYHGSHAGLTRGPAWQKEGNKFNAQFGASVGTAGDTDGDGYSDVIVGAPSYDNGQIGEGMAFVYEGGTTGLSTAPLWSQDGDQGSAQYGYSVGTAGDVNGDGYADIIVGARLWNSGGTSNGGGAWVYHGSSTGPHATHDWHAANSQASAHFGQSAGSAGDLNGDGYADVIVGAPDFNGAALDEGKVFVYFGNGGPGAACALRQFSFSTRLAWLGQASENRFRLGIFYRSPFGRGGAGYEIETKRLGRLFNSGDTHISGGEPLWHHEIPGVGTVMSIGPALRAQTPHHWRMRIVYDPATTPWMPASRWMTVPWNGWNETDLRTGGGLALVPLVTRDHDG